MRDLTLLDGSGLAVFEAAYSSKKSDVSIVVCKTLLGTHDRIGITQKVQAPVALASWYAEVTRIISCRVKAGLPVSSTGLSATLPFATADVVRGDVGLSNLVGVDSSGCTVYQSCTVLGSGGMAKKLESGRDATVLTREHGEEVARILCFVDLDGSNYAVMRWWCIQQAVLKPHRKELEQLKRKPNELFFCNGIRLVPANLILTMVAFQIQHGTNAHGNDYYYHRMYSSDAVGRAFTELLANSEDGASLSPVKTPANPAASAKAVLVNVKGWG
jgi:hypothetical protein